MRDRIDIVKDIASYNGDIKALDDELSCYPWDLKEPILEINVSDVLKILRKAINNEITFNELEDWANLIESRDDFDFKNEELQEIIFLLANPTLNGNIKRESLIDLASKLEVQL